MEHEVFVPVETEPLRRALGDAARVARGIPGLQRDAHEGAEPVSGRLKVRIAGHTITYRGALRVTEDTQAPEPSFAIAGEAAEARGSGTLELTLAVRLRSGDGGTFLTYSGTGKGDGRIADLDAAQVEATVRRLLNRFSENVAGAAVAEAERLAEQVLDETALASDKAVSDEAVPGEVVSDEVISDEVASSEVAEPEADAADAADDAADDDAPVIDVTPSVFEAEVPSSPLDPFHQDAGDESFIAPPAEAAHARRTMIGRSAEEVDHAPPRGRYAPVPAPQSGTAGDTLRWAAPAAALVVASAIVVTRVLRRRK